MEKERVVLFGAGGSGKKLFEELKKDGSLEIVAFADNFKRGELLGLPVLAPEELLGIEFDTIYIASVAATPIEKELLAMGIRKSKISKAYVEIRSAAREKFLERYAQEAYRKGTPGNVAEAGVFQGDFAALINQFFPDRKLYLFDTFEGFDERDIAYESGYETNPQRGDHFRETSVELVLGKMKHEDNCIVRKGYVPDSLRVVDDTFCFVSLDMDLYKPTKEALGWFWPRMARGGVILVHDYFDETGTFPNLKKAVIEFAEESGARTMPIGDDLSIAVIR